MDKKIGSALISVYHKEGLEPVLDLLQKLDVNIYSTGGTASFIRERGIPVIEVETITDYPSILGGRVKTLHPKVFGGILARRDVQDDIDQLTEYEIPEIDLVIVDLYPFGETVKNSDKEIEIIEKIDIGGIALIRAAAKNFKDTFVIPSRNSYDEALEVLSRHEGITSIDDRKYFAAKAFHISSGYDTAIFQYFNRSFDMKAVKISEDRAVELRYGENPHQTAVFYGDLDNMFNQLHGKALSYNNLIDIDSAIHLADEFTDPVFAILKHTNSCGLAVRDNLLDAWKAALAGDPVSAFGGIVITNGQIEMETAEAINKIFIEVIIAPGYSEEALTVLKSKKNRIILERKDIKMPSEGYKNLLNGIIGQDKDLQIEDKGKFNYVTDRRPDSRQEEDLLFALIAVKNLKSNGIALVKDRQLIGIGTGQTSRVDALQQAIAKAGKFNFDLQGAVMASDAFFPFPDCVEIAHKSGIEAVIQPGGSIRDIDSIDYCNANNMAMVTTGVRHFKH